MGSRIKVMMVPSFGSSNPFQEILIDKLEKKGIDVMVDEYGRPRWLFYKLVKNDIDVLDLQFLSGLFIVRKSLAKSMFKSTILVLNLFLARIWCDKVVWTMHNKYNHEENYLWLDSLTRRLVATTVDEVRVWCPNTQETANELIGINKSKMTIIPFTNYIPIYDNLKDFSQESAQEKIGVKEYDRVFLFTGLIRPYKQVIKLINTFKENLDKDSCLVIAGNPADQELEREIVSAADDDNIYLDLEFLPEEELKMYYNAADVAVFPYEHIFNSSSILLSMTLSTPFTAPKDGVVPSYSPAGNFIYEKGNLDKALLEAESVDNGELKDVGQRNRSAAEDKFSWDKVTEQIIEFYQKNS